MQRGHLYYRVGLVDDTFQTYLKTAVDHLIQFFNYNHSFCMQLCWSWYFELCTLKNDWKMSKNEEKYTNFLQNIFLSNFSESSFGTHFLQFHQICWNTRIKSKGSIISVKGLYKHTMTDIQDSYPNTVGSLEPGRSFLPSDKGCNSLCLLNTFKILCKVHDFMSRDHLYVAALRNADGLNPRDHEIHQGFQMCLKGKKSPVFFWMVGKICPVSMIQQAGRIWVWKMGEV
jgi:hypothetical protein